MTDIKVPTSLRKIIPSKNARDQKHKRDETIKYQQTIDRNTSEFKYHNDEFVIMDIPAKEIPQRFRDTFYRMMGELEKIRNELESARAQISYLEEISETHAILPVINRRGLHRELSRLLGLGERSGVINTFVNIHICNIEYIRHKYGQEAMEASLIWVAENLRKNIDQTDILGFLGRQDFGLILTLADAEKANNRVLRLTSILEKGFFSWNGEIVKLKISFGLHSFQIGENADFIIKQVNDDLLKKQREQTETKKI